MAIRVTSFEVSGRGASIVDWFVSDQAKADPERRRRCNLTAISAIALAIMAVPLLALNYYMVGDVGPTVITFSISILILLVSSLLLRTGISERLIGAVITFDLMISIGLMTFFNGGMQSASIVWMIPIPLVGQFLHGRKFALLCAVFTIVELLVFYGVHLNGTMLPSELSAEERLLWLWIGALTSVLFVAGLGWYFEKERMRAEETRRASDERLRMVVASSDVMLLSLDAKGTIGLSVGKSPHNGELEPADLTNTSVFDLFPDAQAEGIQEALEGTPSTFESNFEGRFLETSLIPVRDEDGELAGATCLSMDLTDRKRMEESVALSDRMASLGALAAGVGHEINNPLTYILANIEFVLDEMGREGGADEDSLRAALVDAREGAARVQQIVSDLRQFARPSSSSIVDVDVRKVIESAITMAKHEIDHRAELVTSFEETPRVLGNDGQFGQVVLNLLINAAQAIPPGAQSNNKITVSTRTSGTDQVVIEVADTGEGIAPEALARIFQPFFTTKSVSGTGLGLSISHRIIEAMGGTIEAESVASGGTVFRVTVPAANAAEPVVRVPTDVLAEDSVVPLNILVVDDQTAILKSVARMLRPHRVVTASSGREALGLLEKNTFDLILCDLMMPEITGIELYEILLSKESKAAESMSFMTGGVFTHGAEEFLQALDDRYINKPFNRDELQTFIADRIDSPV